MKFQTNYLGICQVQTVKSLGQVVKFSRWGTVLMHIFTLILAHLEDNFLWRNFRCLACFQVRLEKLFYFALLFFGTGKSYLLAKLMISQVLFVFLGGTCMSLWIEAHPLSAKIRGYPAAGAWLICVIQVYDYCLNLCQVTLMSRGCHMKANSYRCKLIWCNHRLKYTIYY